MNLKITGAAILALILCAAQSAVAQTSEFLTIPTSTNTTSTSTSLILAEPPSGRASILIRVTEANRVPFNKQAVVQLHSEKTESAVYGATERGGQVTFKGLAPGRYTIKVSAAGYRTTQRTTDIAGDGSRYESLVELHRDTSAVAVLTAGAASLESEATKNRQSDPRESSADAAADWRPAGVDEEKLVTAIDTECPCENVLNRVAERVDEFVTNANRFAATEQLTHEDLNSKGKVVVTEHRKFDYVVSINQLPSGELDVDEFRNGKDDFGGFPEEIATLGLPSLAFVFHQNYKKDFSFNCEGLGDWRGHAAWLVYFRQRPDQPRRIRGYNINGVLYPVSLKGRAWIAADSFQVMRMEADLVEPVPEIKLRDEHQVIEYRPVFFQKSNAELWLPASADLYFDFRHHKYHRVHSFSGYLLFSVTASQKIGMPKELASE